MPIKQLSELLGDARKNQYAVGCFNVVNMESLEAILEAAEENRSPVIFAIAQIHLPYINMTRMVPMMRAAIEASNVDAAIILDHAYDQEVIEAAIESGMNAIMFDISMLGFEDHKSKMKTMVDYCHANNVEVEGELGFVGRASGSKDYEAEKAMKTGFQEQAMFTDPVEAQTYIEETSVTGLAVSIGNTHGQYTATADIQFDLLAKINELASVPLVMHGSSGIPDEDLKEAVKLGISKVNYYTGLSKAGVDAIRATLEDDPSWKDYHPLMKIGKEAIKDIVVSKLKVLGSINRL